MGGTVKPRGKNDTGILRKMRGLPNAVAQLFKQQASLLFDSPAKLTGPLKAIPVSTDLVGRLEKGLKHQLDLLKGGVMSSSLTTDEKLILHRIKERTQQENRNNVTRTNAYWSCYQDYPELHWALLAHMVSRNGGWCMTDLRGELLPHLISSEMGQQLFAFLERANGLIFQDAYPQLLLYGESKRRKMSLFHLLPHMDISAWMVPVWSDFWTFHESAALTIALIVNEQNYIEKRIVQNKQIKQNVLNTPLFKTQAWLQMNQIGFPFFPASLETASPQPQLAGLILENFASLTERIEFGKSLYAILFGAPEVLQGVLRFAASVPHTGSRSDYWPHLFTQIRKAPPEVKFQERLDGWALKKGTLPFYSPTLTSVWSDRSLAPVEPGDWFTNVKEPLEYLRPIPVPLPYDLTKEAYFSLSKLELGIVAAQAIRK
jgi:hypothetical protein